MRTKKSIAVILAFALAFTMSLSSSAFAAESEGYLSLGADLSEAERNTVMDLMGVDDPDNYEVLYVTNADEHKYLDSYVSSDQIGSRALSSVLIKEKSGDDIDVEIHNIGYCTEGMYRNALQTAGVEGADSRPFILLVPGGGFVNVWNLTEGWPVAAQFNRLGYHVFILTYQVAGRDHLLEQEMNDFARALCLIRDRADRFRVDWQRYITCGFSAGGYLVCLWNVPEKGYASHGMPKPQAVFPVYPVVSWKQLIRYTKAEDEEEDAEFNEALFGCDIVTAANSAFEIPDHTEEFPPCAIFVAGGDELVNPENSRLLHQALERNGIPCRLEVGPSGGHGFADGTGMCMAGWTERAVRWYEGLQ